MKTKLKDNSGLAMIVAIFCIIIVSILDMYITRQIANQLKSSKSTYENMQVLYLAESSIEKTIYDLENQIYNNINNKSRYDIDLYFGEWINVDHSKHENTKVIYIGEKVTPESFEQLIFKELLNTNGSKDTFWTPHSQVIADMQIIDQSTSNNFKIITDTVWQLGGYLISSAYNSEENLKVFINSINESINQLNYANKIYEVSCRI